MPKYKNRNWFLTATKNESYSREDEAFSCFLYEYRSLPRNKGTWNYWNLSDYKMYLNTLRISFEYATIKNRSAYHLFR